MGDGWVGRLVLTASCQALCHAVCSTVGGGGEDPQSGVHLYTNNKTDVTQVMPVGGGGEDA